MRDVLYLLDGQRERLEGPVVITAYTITTFHNGVDRVVDHANTIREAEMKRERWRDNNPRHPNEFKIT